MKKGLRALPISSQIPYYVRYSQRLSNFAKILFSELLIYKQHGDVCIAENRELADLYNVTPRTIINTLNELIEENLIYKEFVKVEGQNQEVRRLIVRELL